MIAATGAEDAARRRAAAGNGVHAVVVAFHPAPGMLDALLASVAPQVDAVWVMDNAGDARLGEATCATPVHLVRNGANVGLARSYNLAVAQARLDGAHHVLLLDQDSLPAPDMVPVLLAALRRLRHAGSRVAVVGPGYTDGKWAAPVGFVRRQGLALVAVDAAGRDDVAVDHLISSGSLIPLDAYDRVGGFEESLFIDYVDIEWCLRAASLGFECVGIPAARMRHALGDRLVAGDAPALAAHAPSRMYYQYRNALWLMARPWVGWHWRLLDARRLAVRLVRVAQHAPDRWASVRMSLLGAWHALRGRMGPLDA